MKKKVKMLTGMAGSNYSYAPNDVIEVESKVAKEWHEKGIAEVIVEKESASKKAKETANKKKPTQRKK